MHSIEIQIILFAVRFACWTKKDFNQSSNTDLVSQSLLFDLQTVSAILFQPLNGLGFCVSLTSKCLNKKFPDAFSPNVIRSLDTWYHVAMLHSLLQILSMAFSYSKSRFHLH